MDRELERRHVPRTPENVVALLTEAFERSSLLYIIDTTQERHTRIQELLTKKKITPVLLSLHPLRQQALPQLQPHQQQLLRLQLRSQLR